MNKYIILMLMVCSCSLWGNIFEETKDIPVSYKGRFRPLEASSRLWLHEFSHREKVGAESSLDFLWRIHFLGHAPWDDTSLFWIRLARVKALLGLEMERNRFSFNELQKSLIENRETNLRVIGELIRYEFLSNYSNREKLELSRLVPGLWVERKDKELVVIEAPKSAPWHFLKGGTSFESRSEVDKVLSDEILGLFHLMDEYARFEGELKIVEEALESRFPLSNRLRQAGNTIMALPGHFSSGEWFSLKALKLKVYDQEKQQLVPIRNFTLFSDERFEKIRSAYLNIEAALLQSEINEIQIRNEIGVLTNELKEGYVSLGGTVFKEAIGKTLSYPSTAQIKIEQIYYEYPLIGISIFFYALAICLFIFRFKSAIYCMALGFVVHTVILGLRCFILQRPPVSNMFETVIYVPWIAVLASFILSRTLKNSLILVASCATALALLVLLKVTNINSSLENVQAVLDSQYWLIIHVLMVVGSYGLFILSGVVGHFYLVQLARYRHESQSFAFLSKLILQSMYLGLALLIPGTILGGVWAAESWGRFWDWDPKESWAFISVCIYLIVVHAYTFHKIGNFGLAVGSVAGLLAISFTWYGVNYILGTGLHTYGFGSGGEFYYYLYFFTEVIFLFIIFFIYSSLFEKLLKRIEKMSYK